MNKEDLLSYQIRLSLVKVEGFPRDSLQQIEPIEHTKIVEVKKLDDAKEGYRILKGMLKYMNRDNHTLSQTTKDGNIFKDCSKEIILGGTDEEKFTYALEGLIKDCKIYDEITKSQTMNECVGWHYTND